MVQRRFGPTRGAGVAIEEQQGAPEIQPGALGVTGYAGIWEKGEVGELSVVSTRTLFLKRHGSFIEDSLAPDAALDFFALANGAGQLLIVRVTDGNEVAASRGFYQRLINAVGDGPLAAPSAGIAAKNGGRWGGKEKNATFALDLVGDLTETTLQLPAAVATLFTTDEWKDGRIELSAVVNKSYNIVSSTNVGFITVDADQTMATDHAADPDLVFYLVLENEGKEIRVLFEDGEDLPDAEFSLTTFVDDELRKKYPNLSTDPANGRYWVGIINNDDGNDEIVVTDNVGGAHVATTRPANHWGVIDTVTATILTQLLADFAINSPGGGDPTLAMGTTTDEDLRQTLTITMTSALAGDVVSDKFGALGTHTLGTLFDPHNAVGGAVQNKWAPPFTVTVGGSPLIATDVLVIDYLPFEPDELIGGFVYPDKPNAKRVRFRIVDNAHNTITVVAGSDMTLDGAPGDQFLVEASLALAGGRDGNADLADADFTQQAWDTDASPFNRTAGKNFGLIKFGTPGQTATAVQKAGQAYAEAKNHQYRYEVPVNIVTDVGAEAHVNDTLGRSEYAVVAFPSFGDVSDPNGAGEGKLKQISLTGAIHGREARIAVDFDGFHKAAAGITATLPAVLKIPTGDTLLDEELLNPAGIQVIKKNRGNFIIWGDRTVHVDPQWRFKHQRELMSHYEQVLLENFDIIIFAINDAINDKEALTALRNFFRPEFVKRAIRGATLDDAAIIKVDAENNTDATRGAGDQFADIALRLADTVERFRIRIGKQGVFEG